MIYKQRTYFGKRVLDCPSGVSSFVQEACKKGIDAHGNDIIYQFDKDAIVERAQQSIEKIYENTAWMNGFNFDFYGDIQNHKRHREQAFKGFDKHYSAQRYSNHTLPVLDYPDQSFDLILSSHLLFVYDDRFTYEFHLQAIQEMLRVAKKVQIFPLINFQNPHEKKEKNFSPYVYRLLDDLKEYKINIEKVNFEFQLRGNYQMVINN